MSERKPIYIISDDPARKDKVVFGFEAYARTLAELIAFGDNRTPMVVGTCGPWGSGKTTLMGAITDEMEKEIPVGKTTRVTRYPNGISPVGCYDMA